MAELDLIILQDQVAAFVTKLYGSPDLPHYPYHNLDHTRSVVDHTGEMVEHYGLGETDAFVLTVAAWFHDTGHLYGEMQGHEERGVGIMEEYLRELAPGLVAGIGRCILVTKMPSHPVDLVECIICDADTYHLGTDYFRQTDPLVHQEVELRTGKSYPNWDQKTLALLRQHRFFTDYCQEMLNEKKQENIAWLAARGQDS